MKMSNKTSKNKWKEMQRLKEKLRKQVNLKKRNKSKRSVEQENINDIKEAKGKSHEKQTNKWIDQEIKQITVKQGKNWWKSTKT